MAEGLIEYEASLLPHGIPSWIALDDEAGTWLEAEPITDYGLAAIEQATKQEKDPEPGTRYRVIDTRLQPKPTTET